MKKTLCLCTLMFTFFFVHAQKISFSSNGHVNTFRKIDSLFLTEYPGHKPAAKTGGIDTTLSAQLLQFENSYGLISRSRSAAQANTRKLSAVKNVFTTSFYMYTDGGLQAPTSTVFFKPANEATVAADFARYGAVQKHPVFTGFYNLQLNTDIYNEGDKVFALCDSLHQVGLAAIIEPVFLRQDKLDADPLLPQQWNITNTGQTFGTPGADMKVSRAWALGYTGTGIKVAVIDLGVDLNHPDLQSNLLPGYDATGNNSGGAPANNTYNTHGTNCAGIIAEVQNNIGGVGVAYNSKIIPIRLGIAGADGSFSSSDAQKANCINFAVNNGADIISNSWTSSGSPSVQMEQAITNAVQNGRGGKGTIVLFSSGNDNSAAIGYPASFPAVIAVGASSDCDQRKSPTSCDGETWWGGNYGTGLDLMAPGVHIVTTTLPATAGNYTNAYINNFNGTSAACPNTAAVVALVLSVNPALTGQQARQIVESTCDKVGGYTYQTGISGQPNGTWASEAGYGRVNAFRAVMTAMNVKIAGADVLCLQGTYSISNLPAGATVTWSASPSSSVTLTPQGNNVLVQKNTGTGTVILTAQVTLNGAVYTTEKSLLLSSYSGPSHIALDPGLNTCMTFGSTRYFYAQENGTSVCNSATISEIEWQVRDYSTSPATTVTNYTVQNCGGVLRNAIGINLHSNGSPYVLEIVCRAKDKCGNWGPWGPGYGYTIKSSCSSFKAFTMSPNPASTNVIIAVSEDMEPSKAAMSSSVAKGQQQVSDEYEIQIWHSSGRLMKKMKGRGKTTSVSLAGLEKGLYYVNVIRDGVTYKDMLLIE